MKDLVTSCKVESIIQVIASSNFATYQSVSQYKLSAAFDS